MAGYGITQETKTTTGGSSFIDNAGVYPEMRLASASVGPLKTDSPGSDLLHFHFESPKGETFRHTIWSIDENRERTQASVFYKKLLKDNKPPKDKSNNLVPESVFVQQRIDNAYSNQMALIKYILAKYTPEETIIVGGNSYLEFARNLTAFVATLNTAAYFPLLIILNNKNYAQLPYRTPFFGESVEELRSTAIKNKYKMEPTEADDDSMGGGQGTSAPSDDEF